MATQCVDPVSAEDIIGSSPAIEQLRAEVVKVSCLDVDLLLQGESGTGKELVARTVHGLSRRRTGPFVGVNCAAIHESLVESQLFGHEAGAFTGAQHAGLGFFRAAHEGTILLDEIGDMSAGLQSKLLRVLDERAVVPVGGTKGIPIDIRVIAATNCDLAEAVRKGTFRRDLYYRLNVICLSIPPLRERRGDIPELAEHMLRKIADAMDLPVRRFSLAVIEALVRHDWPGNVRELSNVGQHAYVLGTGPIIKLKDLPDELRRNRAPAKPVSAGEFPSLEQAIHWHVQRALELSGGVRSRAARMLGIDRKRLYRMLHRYSII